jgi:hypothetical protein
MLLQHNSISVKGETPVLAHACVLSVCEHVLTSQTAPYGLNPCFMLHDTNLKGRGNMVTHHLTVTRCRRIYCSRVAKFGDTPGHVPIFAASSTPYHIHATNLDLFCECENFVCKGKNEKSPHECVCAFVYMLKMHMPSFDCVYESACTRMC